MNQLSRALEFVLSQAWAIEPGYHRRMMQVLVRHAAGVRLAETELEAATGSALPRRGAEMRIEGRTAIVPIHGVIAHRAGAVGRVSSRVGTSVEHIRSDLQAALENTDVDAIVLDIDSPGGSVAGIEELAGEIRAARAQKAIVAHTEGMMASAAYWLGSQANRIVASRSAAVGSIGVIAAFYDDHRAAANQGLDPVVIKSTPAKGGMQGNGTLSDADRADIQREVDQYHRLFVEAVAAGRGVTAEKAAELADGRVYIGADAMNRGFVDAVATHDAVIRLARGLAGGRAPARAAASATVAHESVSPRAAENPSPAATESIRMHPMNAVAAMPEGEAKWRAEFAASADLQTEFAGDASLYVGFKSNEQTLAARGGRTVPVERLAVGDVRATSGAHTAAPGTEERWRIQFAARPELQAEFGGDVELYIGWQRNEQALRRRRERA